MRSAEVWATVDGFPDYQVSTHGRVRSWAAGRRTAGPRILRQSTTSVGYRQVALYRDGAQHPRRVHRLVAAAFVEGSGSQVNHLNGVKTDNRVTNLEWTDAAGNAGHAVRLGLNALAARDTCQNGHPFGSTTARGRRGRVCRTCANEASARYRAARKERADA